MKKNNLDLKIEKIELERIKQQDEQEVLNKKIEKDLENLWKVFLPAKNKFFTEDI